jgi:MFS family permease
MHPRLVLSAGNFFGAVYFSLVLTVYAPYLAQFLPEAQVGLVVSAGALVTLFAFPYMPRLVRMFGARSLAIMLAFSQALLLSVLALSPGAIVAIASIAAISATAPLIAYLLDLLLEAASDDEAQAGRVRTFYITAASLAYILGPLVIGAILGEGENYALVFLASSLSLTPFIALLALERLPEEAPPRLHTVLDTCHCVWKDADLRAVMLAGGILSFFFSLAPLYIPLYLHSVLGFAWQDLGWVFAFMLLPFLLIEYPAGYIADRWLGIKELLLAGFAITGVAFALVGLITSTTPLLLIAGILFLTRVGAALIEAMTESHFFRRVSGSDVATISVFRMTRPLGTALGPLVGSALLVTGNYVAFFFVTGALILALGVFVTLPLKDSR